MPGEITLRVNGQDHRVSVDPDTPLLYVLRNDLGLKGAKLGCGLGQCGACTVLVDGRATPSCRLPVRAIRGREITTVEGLGTPEHPHPLQEAFVAEGAAQCGYCTAGMVVAAAALLKENPSPSDDEIRAHMAGNICRCGTHERVLRAIRRAAGPASAPAAQVEMQEAATLPGGASPGPAETLPRTLAGMPDLDAWLQFDDGGTVTLFSGKAELGQGIRTAIALIGADELDVSLERVQVVMADTSRTPNEGYTVSSMSLETSGNAIRYAAAEVRRIALSVAHEELEAPVERLTVHDGTISDPATGRSVTYWDLFAGKRFGVQASGSGQPKGSEAYEIVGRPAIRLDLLAKVTGRHRFVHDLDLSAEGTPMAHGRVLLPPRYGSRLASVDEGAARQLPGVLAVVRDGSFLGVVAEREEQAVHAMEALRESATWAPGLPLPRQEALFEGVLGGPDQAFLVVDGTPTEDPIPPVQAPEGAARTLSATYYRPYHMHASLGPSAAAAQWREDELTVWTHSQGVYPLRAAMAQVLDVPEERIHAIHVDGPGCYGHNGADDVALDAALLARAVPRRAVLLKWTRTEENTWEPYGPATVVQMQASLDAGGSVIDWNHDVWGYTHSGRPRGGGGSSALLAAWHLEEPFDRPEAGPSRWHEVGIHRNANPLYTFPQRRIVKHFLPDGPLRVSALRGLGSYANVFALESFVDEVAHAAGEDPIAFRLRYLDDDRARAVIEAAAERAGERREGLGRGVAFAQYKNRQAYVAVVIDLSVDRESGEIHIDRAVIAADAGQVVHPEGLRSQLEGACLQSASWTLFEEVGYGPDGITSTDWRSYPVMRFPAAPRVEVVLLNRPGYPFLGVGEGAQGPSPAAISNAVYDAAGIRLRRIPFTPERVKAALHGEGG
ncbi:MAG: molybdopterin cofactor-binding domain-containing protein [Anaerolineae bacterium]